MSVVIDSSVALTWCFQDEQTPATLALLDRVVEHGAVAPALWPLEVLNALTTAQRRKRIDSAQRQQLTGLLHALPIDIDPETHRQAWAVTAQLAQRYSLTLYDAVYLELAQRLVLPLATLDKELRAAALALGVTLWGLPA